jgi:hypothetical protein
MNTVHESARNRQLIDSALRSTALLLMLISACANTEYRVERMDGSQATNLPLKFESMFGTRDGESVTATPVFTSGMDVVRLDLHIRLGPPITFVSGSYKATVGNQTVQGPVVCDSLSFLGGQNALPSVGGVFRLHDNSTGRTLYRIKMPPTPITRRSSN